jgi:hypothetical protein
MRVPTSARRECKARGLGFREGVHGAGHAVLNVLPLHLMCNPKDVGTEVSQQSLPLTLPSSFQTLTMYGCLFQPIN